MANRQVGEVKLVAGDATYTMRFGSYAIAQMEDELDMPMLAFAQELEDPNKRRMKTLGVALWASLQEHHGDAFPQTKDAFRLMDAAGFELVGEKLVEALNLAFPEAEAPAEGNGNRKTRRAAAAKAR